MCLVHYVVCSEPQLAMIQGLFQAKKPFCVFSSIHVVMASW
jgi:hypothetical protein